MNDTTSGLAFFAAVREQRDVPPSSTTDAIVLLERAMLTADAAGDDVTADLLQDAIEHLGDA